MSKRNPSYFKRKSGACRNSALPMKVRALRSPSCESSLVRSHALKHPGAATQGWGLEALGLRPHHLQGPSCHRCPAHTETPPQETVIPSYQNRTHSTFNIVFPHSVQKGKTCKFEGECDELPDQVGHFAGQGPKEAQFQAEQAASKDP